MPAPTFEIRIVVSEQRLHLLRDDRVIRSWPVSTAAAGTGFEPGSGKTPLGRLVVGEKIGAGAVPGTVFRDRLPTGRIGQGEDPEDLIQSRILWLFGLDPENANTRERYIYIHGTNREESIGRPVSRGCIRMRNADVIELHDFVDVGTPVRVVV
ncbi:MAG: L,D-transpeptidase [Planctomycetes bacterium]|jgi:lipoprotein-anchoring transpeptidase ErfK/SrfK|nr:L,D-transpeptidase [Planctomycetota bacterium]